ncbi:hypothetical protein SCUCBS95973_001540 [Sporothrix curviconia]|uniref:FAD-binding PCMH-type domain-containing protein n=1 Tax=Sporothrix curviconia TaxID=1260050 RepID=A0ABP0AZK8_9PEZI
MRFGQILPLAAFAVESAVAAAVCKTSPLDTSSLVKKLSAGAYILNSTSAAFADAAARWSSLDAPVPNLIVVPATEQDVVQTVLFANKQNVPFLATNGAHGSVTSLGGLQGGIEIYLTQLSSIDISADGTTVTVAGGVHSKNLTDALWAANKQTVTGTCECVSYLGPGLGGGHGWLQGHHGLVSDQFLSLNVVLASGELVTVSETSNPDLFWSMRGAGHNFGIVTSVTSKIYDVEFPNYAIQTVTFSGDQVEAAYTLANELFLPGGVSTQPATFSQWSYWFFEPELDASGPVLQFYLIEEGVDAVNATVVDAFNAISPLSSVPATGTYLDLAAWTGIDISAGPCQKIGNAYPRFPIYLTQYDPAAVRNAYTLFKEMTTANGSLFTGSLFLFEGYSQEGVKAPGDDATAFAYRADNILGAPMIAYTPDGTAALDQTAANWGTQMRNALWAGASAEGSVGSYASLHSYVNYAFGDETQDSWYGEDAWRQTKLTSLKKQYDPKGVFSFYAPIKA